MRYFASTLPLATVAILGWVLLNMSAAETFPDFDQLPSRPELPDPLVMFDGTPVASADDWQTKRKPELKKLFQHYMYGQFPAATKIFAAELTRDEKCLGGKATLKEITIAVGPPECPRFNVLIVTPNKRPASGKSPVFVTLNFTGNHTVMADQGIALPKGWMPEGSGVEDHHATDAGRGNAADKWPVEDIIDRGYALATLYYGDVMPDKPDYAGGIYPYFRQTDKPERTPTEWGAIAVWAWGLQRAIDYVVSDPQLDPQRIAVFGHSRNGKAALLAAAFDDRIAAVIPHQAGCGGTAPSRRKNQKGEPVARINKNFPHWFDEIFHQFGEHEDKLPFDQHCLIAICAPRAVLLTNGDEDQWADPAGQFEMLQAAAPVYRLLGREGLPAGARDPQNGTMIGAELSYYVRHAPHTVDKQYWGTFMDFTDRIFSMAK